MKLFKSLLCSLVLTGAASVIGQEAVKAVPGAALYVYKLTDASRPDPEADPLTVIVDKSEAFVKRASLEKKPGIKAICVLSTLSRMEGILSDSCAGDIYIFCLYGRLGYERPHYHPIKR